MGIFKGDIENRIYLSCFYKFLYIRSGNVVGIFCHLTTEKILEVEKARKKATEENIWGVCVFACTHMTPHVMKRRCGEEDVGELGRE